MSQILEFLKTVRYLEDALAEVDTAPDFISIDFNNGGNVTVYKDNYTSDEETDIDFDELNCHDALDIKSWYESSAASAPTVALPDNNSPELYIRESKKTETPPSSTGWYNLPEKEPTTLHLYSNILGAEENKIETTGTNQEAVARMIQNIFKRFFSILFTLSGILMVIMLAAHGTRMIYAEFSGNVPALSNAKGKVKAAALGTAILLLSWIILDFIDPALLRPKLFETVTQLREVGSSNSLFSSNLIIPDANNRKNPTVKYDEDAKILTIKVCPKINDDNFARQVESARASLQNDKGGYGAYEAPQFYYQILYSDFKEGKTYLHIKGRQDITYEEATGLTGSESKDNTVGLIECNNNPNITAEIPYTDNIVVFPIVSIRVKGEKSDEPQIKKFWRGLPWKYKPDINEGELVEEILVLNGEAMDINHENPKYPPEQHRLYQEYCENEFSGEDIQKCKDREGLSRINITVPNNVDQQFRENLSRVFGEIGGIYYTIEGAESCRVEYTPGGEYTVGGPGGGYTATRKEKWVEWCNGTSFTAGELKLVKVKIGKPFTIIPSASIYKNKSKNNETKGHKAKPVCFLVKGDRRAGITSVSEEDCD